MSDERAVEAAQGSQPLRAESPQVSVAYFEPHKLVDLARHGRLYLLADGTSGAAEGHVASQYTVKKILHHYYTADTPDPQTRLQQAIEQANTDIFEYNCQHPKRRPRAVTLIAALIHNNKLLVASVGDSQVYVAWGQDIELLTEESPSPEESKTSADPPTSEPAPPSPSVSSTGVSAEEKTSPGDEKAKVEPPKEAEQAAQPEEAKPDSLRGRLPQSLGLEKKVVVDIYSRRLFPGDTVILCSGALTGHLTDKEIARAISRHPLDDAIRRLLALAAERGNRDHAAISITRLLSSPVALRPPTPMTLPDAPKWSDWETVPKPATAPTKPTAKPIAASSPTGKLIPTPQAKPPSTDRLPYLSQQPTRLPWKGCLLTAGILVVLCVALIVGSSYLLPPDTLAAVPFLSDVQALILGEDESVAVDLPPNPSPQAEQSSSASPTASAPTVAATPVAESNSPVPTPDSAFNSPVLNSPVSTPTPAKASGQDTLPTSTPQASPTPSPSPLPTITLPVDCESKGRFRRDVTIPDGTQLAPGKKFEKVWLVQNAGTCPWGPGYTVRHIEGEPMAGNVPTPLLEVVPPNTDGEISVSMTAPTASGNYRGTWQVFDLNGDPFGPELYVEIEVSASSAAAINEADSTTLFDFVEQAEKAEWKAGDTLYTPLQTEIDDSLELPAAAPGLVAIGPALLRGNIQSEADVLLTHPDRQQGFIEGAYSVDTPLQPTDSFVARLGFIKLPILPDDGVTFEVAFIPTGGAEQVIFSQLVQYQDSPVSVAQPLSEIQPGQSGTFTLRVLGGNSLTQDWATWIDARLVRP